MVAKIVFDPVVKRFRQNGRFVKRAAFVEQNRGAVENYLRTQLGRPPSGQKWVVLAAKYPERFADYIEGFGA